MTITEFLLARIAEDEAAIKRWADALKADDIAGVGIPAWVINASGLKVPRDVLAECEAKRRIVELFEEERVRSGIYNRGYDDGLLTTNDDLRQRLASNARCQGLKESLLALASGDADHPDYEEAWRP